MAMGNRLGQLCNAHSSKGTKAQRNEKWLGMVLALMRIEYCFDRINGSFEEVGS